VVASLVLEEAVGEDESVGEDEDVSVGEDEELSVGEDDGDDDELVGEGDEEDEDEDGDDEPVAVDEEVAVAGGDVVVVAEADGDAEADAEADALTPDRDSQDSLVPVVVAATAEPARAATALPEAAVSKALPAIKVTALRRPCATRISQMDQHQS